MKTVPRQRPSDNATSSGGMVVAPHWLATEAGAKVLEQGGNAIEALVAASAALSVLYPHFCGLGGDAVWLVADRAGSATVFLGIGQAARFIPDLPAIPLRGPLSAMTTACLVDSWGQVLDYSHSHWQGRLSITGLLDDAVALAQDGFDVSPSQEFWHRFRASEVTQWPGFQEIFSRDGIQRQPALASSLRAIADRGVREFYEGELGARIASGLRAAGSPLTAADLTSTRTLREQPLMQRYRDVTLLAPPPPTQGATTLAIMGVLSSFDLGRLDPASAEFYHLLVEAVKRAFLDRPSIADPTFTDVNIARLLDGRRLAAKARSIELDRALPWPQPFQTADTAFLAATDSAGRSVAMLQSLYFDWGSGVVAGDTGILWQNRGAAFSLDPASPNCIRAGKRPFYTLNPGIALKDGRPCLLYGTQGADGQPQTLALLLSLLIDHGLDPLAALSRPRFLLGRTFSDSRDSLKIEAHAGGSLLAELADRGHQVGRIEPFSQLGGHAGIIRLRPDGTIIAAHDPRSDGGAIGL
ncbi:gamma-glutamyltransferase family protein [Labrys portucalensis]|uniref:Gamma-glutamyltransferase family protein n=2 Tax=Labrys TaxID=204476 RepID=A0ABV6ZNM2_9HYPH